MFSFYSNTPLFLERLTALFGPDVSDDGLLAGIEELAAEHGNAVYREALLLLTGKRFGSDLSNNYWHAAVSHCYAIIRPEFAGRCFRPALLDYLQNVVGELNDPRLIEGEYLNNITRSSVTDGLTGLYNQTYFKRILDKAIVEQRRSGDNSFAVVLFDLDHFKQYNDRCGHLLGDEALRQCAEIINGSLREGDIAVRYGGEEFAVLLPNLDRVAAYTVAERIRKGVEEHLFLKQELLDSGNLTISGGIAVYPESGSSTMEIIEAADQELYQAKVRRNFIYYINDDRRRYTRRPVKSLVEYASFDGALYRPALSTDISETGIGLGCESPLAEGMTLSLRLTKPYWPENLHLTAKVRQVRYQDDLFYLGLEFDQPLDTVTRILNDKSHSLFRAV